jgi:hypothetical protein
MKNKTTSNPFLQLVGGAALIGGGLVAVCVGGILLDNCLKGANQHHYVDMPIPPSLEVAKPAEVADPDSEKQDYLKGMTEEEKVEAVKALIIESTEPPNRFLPNGAR